jgi:pSer/pThr/pTyr-binding forkhead associated (FHA) protein
MVDEKAKEGAAQAVADREAAGSIAETPVDAMDKTVVRSMDEGEETTPARPQYTPPYMIVIEGPRTGARFPLSEGQNVIGRAPSNAVRLEDQSVSRQHSEVSKGDSGWIVKDLGSKNGTIVNGNPIQGSVVIGHKDVVKTGIYQLRLITQPTSVEDEMALPPELAVSDKTVFVAAPPDGLTSKMDEGKGETFSEEPSLSYPSQDMGSEDHDGSSPPTKAKKSKKKRSLVMMAVLGIVVISTAAYFAQRTLFKSSKPVLEVAKTAKVPENLTPKTLPPVGSAGAVPPPAGAAQPTPGGPKPAARPTVRAIPVFLDIASSPMSAKITFRGKNIGETPLRANIELAPDKTYTAEALFVMPEIGERYTQKLDFRVEKDSSVIPILFRGPVGMIKVIDIPRDVEFYLEGTFSHDRFNERSAKLKEVILGKPIYVPFGKYLVELRRSRRLGESSSSFVQDIIYRREFSVAEDSPTFVVDVQDESLDEFPVSIRSQPSKAEVFVDGKRVGVTPFKGSFPLGEHKFVLRKEGYFEYAEDLDIDINTPFIADVKMKTSVAGAHINNARIAMNREMYQDAINELAEAMNSSPAPSEIAQSRYMLGNCYLRMGDIQRAMGYFERAKENDAFRYKAMLGLASAYANMKNLGKALPLLVEVLLKSKDEATMGAANNLFQKISPFRSVIYVYSEPAGADVIVNDKPVAQKTPLILHELPLGSYRLKISKAGYQPTELRMSMSVNEFNPVIVKLKPIQE